MFKFIVMNAGYVENAYTSVLVYQCGFFGHSGYETHKEAITNLALDLYAKFYEEYLSAYEDRYSKDVKECCRKVLIKDKNAKFCSDCGQLIADKKFDPDQFKEYICGLHSSTSDSYGDAEWAGGRSLAWWPFWIKDLIGAPKEEVIVIAENAEVVLLEALLESKPELQKECDDLDDSYFGDWERFKNNDPPEYC